MNTRHDEDYNFLFKSTKHTLVHTLIVILVGDTGVGKTHLLSKYIKGSLPKNKFPTIGVEFATKPVPLKTGGTVKA
jgi:Rab family protein